MIVDAILFVLGLVIRGLSSLMPTSTFSLPSASDISSTVGSYAGPFDKWFPASELFTFLLILFLVWFPAVMVYQLVFWIYRHIPVVGAG